RPRSRGPAVREGVGAAQHHGPGGAGGRERVLRHRDGGEDAVVAVQPDRRLRPATAPAAPTPPAPATDGRRAVRDVDVRHRVAVEGTSGGGGEPDQYLRRQ